jgi:hypothetical protein
MNHSFSSFRNVVLSHGGAISWVVHFFLSYLIAEFGCLSGLKNIPFWIAIITAFTFFVAVMACYRSYKIPSQYGLYSNVIFSLIILFETIPIFYFTSGCL